jgi:hypothetical protein
MAAKHYILRLKSDQQDEIDSTITVRADAIALREKVSCGEYGPEDLKKFCH